MTRLMTGMLMLLFISACVQPAVQNSPPVEEKSFQRMAPFARLTVHDEATVEIPPDQLRMRLAVLTSNADSDLAMEENNRQMNALIQTLLNLGLDVEDYRTGQFQTRPEWSRPPRPAPANWQRSIVGYTVSNELLIRTEQVDLAGRLLAAAQHAGANQIGGLTFALAEPADHREEVIALATRRALLKAQTLAAAAGVKLGSIQSLTLDQAAGPGPMPRMEMMSVKAASDAVPVNAGNVEVRAGVTVVFRIMEGVGE